MHIYNLVKVTIDSEVNSISDKAIEAANKDKSVNELYRQYREELRLSKYEQAGLPLKFVRKELQKRAKLSISLGVARGILEAQERKLFDGSNQVANKRMFERIIDGSVKAVIEIEEFEFIDGY